MKPSIYRLILLFFVSAPLVATATPSMNPIKEVKQRLESLAPAKHSVLSEKVQAAKKINQATKNVPIALYAYRPNYVLPAYFTGSPDFQSYRGHTSANQPLRNHEFKYQISFQVLLWQNMFKTANTLKFGYTQQSYWQVYARSPWFRETNYQGEVFISNNTVKNWQFDTGFNHQSNGQGGEFERSWNRVFTDIQVSGSHWFVSFKPWIMVFNAQSRDYHNPDIGDYIGHARLLLVYKPNHNIFSLKIRNPEAKKGRRTTIEGTWSYPLSKYVRSYLQVFSGYGQSLIEYHHHTNSIGMGLALNDYV